MLAIIARYTLGSAADADAFCRHASHIVEPSRAEQGCNYYAFARDINDDTVVWISEEWESEDNLLAHFKTPHIAEFLGNIAGITIVDELSRKYEVSSVGPVTVPSD